MHNAYSFANASLPGDNAEHKCAKRESSGWGLCLAHKYVTAHGGTLGIDSEVDHGTTIIITLPMRASIEGEDE